MMNSLRITALVFFILFAGTLISDRAEALLPQHDCSFCHSLHGGTSSLVPLDSPTNIEVLCMSCHLTVQPDGPDLDLLDTDAVQPHRSDGDAAAFHVSCTDCHEVHDNMENWRFGDPTHVDSGTSGTEGVNQKMIGREDPEGDTPYAIILTREKDFNQNGIPDRGTVTQTCNTAIMNDCYTTERRYVIFEQAIPATSLHAWADSDADGKDPIVENPADPIAIQTNESDSGALTSQGKNWSAYDSLCQMCHTQTSKHNLLTGAQIAHNPTSACTDCHVHDGCFDKSSVCTKWSTPNRDLRVDTVTASPASVDSGQTVTITADVSNLGDDTETIQVKYSSDIEGHLGYSSVADVASGGGTDVTSLDWVTADAGAHTITAYIVPVIGEVVTGNNSGTDTVTVTSTAVPSLETTVYTGSPQTYSAVGTIINYTYLVTNTGTIPLAGPVSVTDDTATGESCPAVTTVGNNDGIFDPAESITCTASYTITQADLNAGSVVSNATATADGTTSPSFQEVVTAIQSPALTLTTYTAAPQTYPSVGTGITYSYAVENTGNVSLGTAVTVADDTAISESCGAVPGGDLFDPGETVACTSSYTITLADYTLGTVTSNATATSGVTTSASVQEVITATGQNAELTITDYTATPQTYGSVGTGISYSYTVENTGNVSLGSTVTVADDTAISESCGAVPGGDLFDPGETVACTASYTTTATDVSNGNVTSNATATSGVTTSASVQEIITYLAVPALALVKTATPSTYSAVDEVISYSFLVTNSGTGSLAGPVTINDDKATDESCPNVNTVGNLDSNLDEAEAITCTASYTITQADLNSGSVTNIATASADGTTSLSDSETVTAIQTPELTITAYTATPQVYPSVGTGITYSYTVENTGNVSLGSTVSVSDDTAISESCGAPSGGSFDPGETVACTSSYTITLTDYNNGSVTSNATATSGVTTSASVQEVITATGQIHELTITDYTATPQTYPSVGTGITYSYTVENTGSVSLGSIVSVTDDTAISESCGAPSGGSFDPGETVACTSSYTITLADYTLGTVTSNATATSGATTSASVQEVITATGQNPQLTITAYTGTPQTYGGSGETINYSYTVENTGNVSLGSTVSISDDTAGSESCGAVPGGDLFDPGETVACTSSYTTIAADVTNGNVTSNATATSGATTSASVQEVVTYAVSVIHDVAVTLVNAPPDATRPTSVTILVTVENLGTVPETFNVELTSNQPKIGNLPLTQPVTALSAGGSTVLTFDWTIAKNTVNAATHTLTATADQVTGETNTLNNFSSDDIAIN